MNHNDPDYLHNLNIVKRGGMAKEALELEKDYVHKSEKRLELIGKITQKCDNNTLILFHTIEYGQMIFSYLKSKFPDKDFFYIDGTVKNRSREEIKGIMEESDRVKVLVASFGTLSTGVSIKNLHYLIMCDSYKSEQIVIQSIGRMLRLIDNKKKAVIFDLVDIFDDKSPTNILYRHSLERKKFYNKRNYPFVEKKINLWY